MARGEAIVGVWKKLPAPPGRGAPFKLGPLDCAAFSLMVTALTNGRAELSEAGRVFQEQQAKVREVKGTMGDFATAAFAHGRALFHARAEILHVVHALPRRRSTPAPVPAKITVAASPQPGAVRLECAAKHATSFEFWNRGPGESGYERVAVEKASGRGALVYETGGWTEGEHVFQVAGVNSRGTGKRSAAVTVQMAQQVAA